MDSVVRNKLIHYYQYHNKEWQQVYNILNYKEKYNLFWLEQFIKKTRITKDSFIDHNGNHFFIYQRFKSEKKGYSKYLFNYHQRSNWCCFQINDYEFEQFELHGITINISLAVLHFFAWCQINEIFQYINDNYQEIDKYISDYLSFVYS